MTIDDWQGCYQKGWQGEIVPEAFSHPAKFSRSLIKRIYQHAIAEGWLQTGDTVVDCFGGVALGGLDAMRHGLHWIGIELERNFIDLGRGCDCTGFTKADWRRYQNRFDRIRYLGERHICPACIRKAKQPKTRIIPCHEPHHYIGNIELWTNKYAGKLPKWGTARIIQGDSRQLASILEQAGACISSPPYADGCAHTGGDDPHPEYIEGGELRIPGLASAISSPPYARSLDDGHPNNTRTDGTHFTYGFDTSGQLGAMPASEAGYQAAISSPPYADQDKGYGDRPNRWDKVKDNPNFRGRTHWKDNDRPSDYGSTPGQLGAMPAGLQGAVSSPPWENIQPQQDKTFTTPCDTLNRKMGEYGGTSGNIGNSTGNDFWSAARTILDQLYQVLAPGAHCIWVVKSFIKDKKIVDFPAQWQQMCEAAGFVTVHIHYAMLVKAVQYDFAGNGHKSKKVSFFRRLAEKRGSPPIDWEEVLCMKK